MWRFYAPSVDPTMGTSLPANPVDGQEFTFVDSMSAPTYSWKLRYVSAKSSNKWIFVGGSAKIQKVDTNETTASSAYTDLATVGPSFTAPLAGIYEATIDAAIGSSAGLSIPGRATLKIGSAAASDTDSLVAAVRDTGTNVLEHVSTTFQLTAAASDVLKMQYKSDGTNAMKFEARHLRIIPIALGG